MSTLEPLSPWAEGTDENAPPERQLSQLFAAVPEPTPLADFARQRVAVRLRGRSSRGVGLTLLRLVAVGVVIGVAGAAGAQWASARFFAVQQAAVVTKNVQRVAPVPLAPQPSLPLTPAARESAEVVVEVEARSPEPAANAAFPAPPEAAPSSRLGQEAASLATALSALKAGGKANAERALRAIDEHLRKFPRGALELEARVARVDALLVSGRRQEARRELSALPIESVGRKNELRLIRAELRADDDCRAALGDFQVLVDQSLPGAWAERALFGRGACLLKLGDKAAAERDFARYLERFPNGRFAAQIRAQQPR
jgi:TolA-binding protein